MVLILLPILFAIWAFFFLPYAEKIPIWLKWKNPKRARLILIILFSILPFGDEIIGRAQFAYLCNGKNLLHVDPDIRDYEVLSLSKDTQITNLPMTAIPIKKGTNLVVSPLSGKIIISEKTFFTNGGFFYRNAIFPNKSTFCHQKTAAEVLYENGFIYMHDGIYINKKEMK